MAVMRRTHFGPMGLRSFGNDHPVAWWTGPRIETDSFGVDKVSLISLVSTQVSCGDSPILDGTVDDHAPQIASNRAILSIGPWFWNLCVDRRASYSR